MLAETEIVSEYSGKLRRMTSYVEYLEARISEIGALPMAIQVCQARQRNPGPPWWAWHPPVGPLRALRIALFSTQSIDVISRVYSLMSKY